VAIPGLSINLYPDHNFDERMGLATRRAGHDVIIAREVGHEQWSDGRHLRWATDHGRTILTYDRADFCKLDEEWAERGEPHAGIIVAVAPPRLPFREALARLLKVLDTVTADEMVGRVFWLNGSWSNRP
jgi:Domain of unknown function (DUF5615)